MQLKMLKNIAIGILRASNGKKSGIAAAIPDSLFVTEPCPQFLDANEQGGQRTHFHEEDHRSHDSNDNQIRRLHGAYPNFSM
jgi:hypothetical protein